MKKAVVTGHSKGLGAGIVKTLLAEGFEVLGLSRSALPGAAAGVEQVALDLGDTDALTAWLDGGELAGFLDGAETAFLINNAGVVEPIAPLGRQDAGAIARSISLNVTAALMLANAFVDASKAADRRIVHISSGAGRHAYTGWSVYCATKAAMDHHATVVVEDGIQNLKIESLAPGVLDTGMQATIRSAPEEDFALLDRFVGLKETGALQDPEVVGQKIVTHMLSDRFGTTTLTDIREL